MSKQKVSIEKTISDLKELFKTENNQFGTTENEGNFYINKKQFERFQVINMLQNYFSDKFIDGGYCSVGNITMVFTDFKILSGVPS